MNLKPKILTTEDTEEHRGFAFSSVRPLCPLWLRIGFYSSAITSISTSTSFGKRATSTVERAGGAVLKYLP
jgi:hypothetical protein